MTVIIQIFLIVFFPAISFGQTIGLFQVTDTILTTSERTRIEAMRKKSIFYEDEQYLVTRSCSGEWGGTVKFKNKKTGIEYSCEATCPVSVNKLGNSYFVTNSLARLSGFAQVLEIASPDSMKVFQTPPPRAKKGRREFRYVGDDQSKSTQGSKVLLDSSGILMLGSFPFEGELFHVVTDFKKTYVAKIENHKLLFVEFITAEQTWSYESEIVKTDDEHLIIAMKGGYLDIFDNQVRVLKIPEK